MFLELKFFPASGFLFRMARRRLPQGRGIVLPRRFLASVHLLEADVLGVLMETLTAHIQAVFADQTVTVAARPAGARALSVFLGMRIPNVAETHFVRISL